MSAVACRRQRACSRSGGPYFGCSRKAMAGKHCEIAARRVLGFFFLPFTSYSSDRLQHPGRRKRLTQEGGQGTTTVSRVPLQERSYASPSLARHKLGFTVTYTSMLDAQRLKRG
ncbi:hypothetical protein NDU88_011402 [Pleurodeles waltl]|uniref:Uncharacterized protein n=1 Tax=Pleurodeles waltl TaxID=8319 RepID=A0AAV7QYN5_PLEWA|nr:hypothetical protein NDU88_011402 [Pleurodeles waltl]